MLERGTYPLASPLTQKASVLSKRKLVYYPRGMLERGTYPLASPLTQKASLLSKRYAGTWILSSSVTTHPES
ncbi:hypothetical protein J6590_100500 [Homalodisca vitripennis]|nr:hypothetical protein J6590_100500 [Homalodisca vitripennis]